MVFIFIFLLCTFPYKLQFIHIYSVITGSIPDVVGLVGRHPDATGSRILHGRDVRSICVLVPDARGLDNNFHDVMIVDMGDVSEASVSLPELSVLREQ